MADLKVAAWGRTENALELYKLTEYNMILHPQIVFKSIANRYWAAVKSLIKKVIIKSGMSLPKAGVVTDSADVVAETERHRQMSQFIYRQVQQHLPVNQLAACEIGAGKVLANADMLLGLGFARSYIIEKSPGPFGADQIRILKSIAEDAELPNKLDILSPENPETLNSGRLVLIKEYFENVVMPEPVDLIFSFDVLEHVEDLPGFFRCCHAALREGGVMIHKIDLSGHSLLEDPIPPLDFQTYPDWLYDLMFGKYERATRNFVSDYTREIKNLGFKNIAINPIQKADADYLDRLWPQLRAAAGNLPRDEVAVFDVVITAIK